MTFQVYIRRWHKEAEPVGKPTTAKQAIRLMGKWISASRYREPTVCEVYAIGSRFGYRYSQAELKRQIGALELERNSEE